VDKTRGSSSVVWPVPEYVPIKLMHRLHGGDIARIPGG